VYENRVVKRILWPRRDVAIENGRRLHNVELYELQCSAHVIRVLKYRRTKWARRESCVRKRGSANRILVGRLDGKRTLRRPGRRWDYNIEMGRAWSEMI